MARFRRTSRTFGRRSPARKRQWSRDTTTTNLITNVTSRHDVLSIYKNDAGITNLGGHTAVRFLISAAVNWPLAPDPTSDVVALALKVENVNQTAPFQATGPIVNPHADWLWWDHCSPGEGGASSLQQAFCTFDLRSKRKLEELSQSIFLYLESPNVDASARVTVQTLLLLP